LSKNKGREPGHRQNNLFLPRLGHPDKRAEPPNQAYAGMLFNKEEYRERLMDARAKRIEVNRRACNPYIPLDLEDEDIW